LGACLIVDDLGQPVGLLLLCALTLDRVDKHGNVQVGGQGRVNSHCQEALLLRRHVELVDELRQRQGHLHGAAVLLGARQEAQVVTTEHGIPTITIRVGGGGSRDA